MKMSLNDHINLSSRVKMVSKCTKSYFKEKAIYRSVKKCFSTPIKSFQESHRTINLAHSISQATCISVRVATLSIARDSFTITTTAADAATATATPAVVMVAVAAHNGIFLADEMNALTKYGVVVQGVPYEEHSSMRLKGSYQLNIRPCDRRTIIAIAIVAAATAFTSITACTCAEVLATQVLRKRPPNCGAQNNRGSGGNVGKVC